MPSGNVGLRACLLLRLILFFSFLSSPFLFFFLFSFFCPLLLLLLFSYFSYPFILLFFFSFFIIIIMIIFILFFFFLFFFTLHLCLIFLQFVSCFSMFNCHLLSAAMPFPIFYWSCSFLCSFLFISSASVVV